MEIYSFILGRKYLLSVAELLSVFESSRIKVEVLDFNQQVLTCKFAHPLPFPQNFLNSIGGTIKIVKIFDRVAKNNQTISSNKDEILSQTISVSINEYLLDKFQNFEQKVKYGISVYSLANKDEKIIKNLLKNSKKILRENGLKPRFVNKDFRSPSNVIISKEKLIEKGSEISLIFHNDNIYIGESVAIQDFENYSKRDYGKPERNPKKGMLPPKIAQIMINLLGIKTPKATDAADTAATAAEIKQSINISAAIYDPFCGNGTILMEALLMGFNVKGSDIDPLSIRAVNTNINWLKQNTPEIKNLKSETFQKDAAKIIKNDLRNINGIVTETYLGPPMQKLPPYLEIKKIFNALTNLYLEFFRNISKFIPASFPIIFAIPAYKSKNDYIYIENLIEKIENAGFKNQKLIPQGFAEKFNLKLNPRGTLIYDREDQTVAREIFRFVKN